MSDQTKPKVDALSNAALLQKQYTDLLNETIERKKVVQGEAQYLEAELKKRETEFQELNRKELLANQSLQTIQFILNNAATVAADVVEAGYDVDDEQQVCEEPVTVLDETGADPGFDNGALDKEASIKRASKVKAIK